MKIWFAVVHPNQLLAATACARLAKNYGLETHLLYSDHDYWNYVSLWEFSGVFDGIHKLPYVNFKVSFEQVFRKVGAIQKLEAEIRRAGLQGGDLIFCFSSCHYLDNVLSSKFPDCVRVLVLPDDLFARRSMAADYQSTFSMESFIHGCLVQPFLGLHRTTFRNNWTGERAAILHYCKEDLEIFDGILITCAQENTPGDSSSPYLLKTCRPFFPEKKGDAPVLKKKIVFFGSGTALTHNQDNRYLPHANRCLDYVRTKYGSDFSLVYRPHPNLEQEEVLLDLHDFTIERDGALAEFYLQKHGAEIECVFTDTSYAAVTSLAFGIPSYSFLKLCPFSPVDIEYFSKAMGTVPNTFWIDSWEDKPGSTVPVAPNRDHFESDLARLTDLAFKRRGKPALFADLKKIDPAKSESSPDRESIHKMAILRQDLQKKEVELAGLRTLRVELERKEKVIQELKTECDNRLNIIKQLNLKLRKQTQKEISS